MRNSETYFFIHKTYVQLNTEQKKKISQRVIIVVNLIMKKHKRYFRMYIRDSVVRPKRQKSTNAKIMIYEDFLSRHVRA